MLELGLVFRKGFPLVAFAASIYMNTIGFFIVDSGTLNRQPKDLGRGSAIMGENDVLAILHCMIEVTTSPITQS